MQALILATDEAPKLRLLADRQPVPMLPVMNRPVMAYPVELLARAGCRDVAVSLQRMAGSIEAYFGTGSRWGVNLTYLPQRDALGSAGALRWAAPGLRSTFIVLPGDAIVDFDVQAALAFHRSHGGVATVIVNEPYPLCPAHPVAFVPGGRVASLSAQTTVPDMCVLADTGVYIFEPQVLDLVPPRVRFDCYSDLLPALLATSGLHAYVTDGYWNPLDNVGAYQQAQLAMLASATGIALAGCGPRTRPLRYPSLQGRQIAPGIVVGRRVAIHPAARMAPPLYIGDGCQIESDVELGPAVVIGSNVIVDEGATISNSSVLDGTYVGRLVKLEGRVVSRGLVADTSSGGTVPVVDPFLLGEVSPEPLVGLLSRAADCAGAVLLFLLWFPAIALIALALLITSPFAGMPGSIFERRPRVRWRRTGENTPAARETYWVVHFRTRRDERRPVPLLGDWLECWQMDRLPALWSVITGDLCLVGVRPLVPSEADRLSEEWQRRCYERPAGFTGLWYFQSTGELDVDSIVVADAYYTATRTHLEDLRLLLRTSAAHVVSRNWPDAVAPWIWSRSASGGAFSAVRESSNLGESRTSKLDAG